MPELDEVQQRVTRFTLGTHRSVIGAPGSGKTAALLELYANLFSERGFRDDEVLVLGVNRLVAKRLREQLDRKVPRPAGNPRARTSTSLAHAVVAAERRASGEPPLRLLTGSVQDELIDELLTADTVENTATFRNQFRELLRVLSDTNLSPSDLEALGAAHDVSQWVEAATTVTAYQQLRAQRLPQYRDAAEMHRAAVEVLERVPVAPEASEQIGDFARLRALLVDDAQELTQSSLNLLRAFAKRGVTIWAFGDPDIATGAFQGSAHRALSDLGATLGMPAEPPLVLPRVYRHPEQIRSQVRSITSHIGTSGLGQQRAAVSAKSDAASTIQFAEFSSSGEAADAIAYRLRQRHLGLRDEGATQPADAPQPQPQPLLWSEMAVVCRTRSEVERLAQQLAAANVPTDVRAGGRTLSSDSIVRDLLALTQLSFGWREVTAEVISALLCGPVGGLDQLSLKRLTTAMRLAEARRSDESAPTRTADELLMLSFADEHSETHVDTRQGTSFRKLARTFRAGQVAAEHGGDLSEVLWALWDSTGLSSRWERAALDTHAQLAAEANDALDAVMALFFAVARFEEQEAVHDREGFVRSLLDSSVPEDSLAQRSRRDSVTVTTPQGMIGRSAKLVVVTQLVEGVWPNLKSRGTLLRLEHFVNVVNGQPDTPVSSRRDVLHDELRLFAQALSRAEQELLCVALHNDDAQPSVLFRTGESESPKPLPSSRLTLRGMVAKLRRQLNQHPDDTAAAAQLALLAREGVPGAHPAEWYGIEELSTLEPLHNPDDPDSTVFVSPSRLEAFETCPLNWAISYLGGDHTVSAAAIGTLIHQALETAESSAFDALMTRVDSGWSVLSFDADWQQERSHRLAEQMVGSLSTYLAEFETQGGSLLGAEQTFELTVGRARVRGTVDRVELRPGDASQPARVLIVDLKTGQKAPSAAEVREHPQLALYQLAAYDGTLDTEGKALQGAALLLVHPKVVGAKPYRLPVQEPLTDEDRELLIQRVHAAAEGMSSATFRAEIEHHCSSEFSYGNCSLHVIPEVSHG